MGRRAAGERHLPRVCLLTPHYERGPELLVEVLLSGAPTFLHTGKREHQDRFSLTRQERQRSVTAFVEAVQHGVCTPLTHLEPLAFCEQMSAEEKVQRIQDVLRVGNPHRLVVEQEAGRRRDLQADAGAEAESYNLGEARALKLPNRGADLGTDVSFRGEEHSALMVALR
jgi:hypothetical protein